MRSSFPQQPHIDIEHLQLKKKKSMNKITSTLELGDHEEINEEEIYSDEQLQLNDEEKEKRINKRKKGEVRVKRGRRSLVGGSGIHISAFKTSSRAQTT